MRACLLSLIAILATHVPGGYSGGLQPQGRGFGEQPPGVLCRIPSVSAGERGIAVRVILPRQPRYGAGAPVVIHVAGGVQAGDAAGKGNSK